MKKSVWDLLAGVLHFVKEPPREALPSEGATVAPGHLCWVVTMFRWGDPQDHSYLIGVFSSIEEAEKEAAKEESFRRGKYKGTVQACRVDQHRIEYLENQRDHD